MVAYDREKKETSIDPSFSILFSNIFEMRMMVSFSSMTDDFKSNLHVFFVSPNMLVHQHVTSGIFTFETIVDPIELLEIVKFILGIKIDDYDLPSLIELELGSKEYQLIRKLIDSKELAKAKKLLLDNEVEPTIIPAITNPNMWSRVIIQGRDGKNKIMRKHDVYVVERGGYMVHHYPDQNKVHIRPASGINVISTLWHELNEVKYLSLDRFAPENI